LFSNGSHIKYASSNYDAFLFRMKKNRADVLKLQILTKISKNYLEIELVIGQND